LVKVRNRRLPLQYATKKYVDLISTEILVPYIVLKKENQLLRIVTEGGLGGPGSKITGKA
jgi:hypothetical protein